MTPQLDLNNKLDFELNELKHAFTHHDQDEILSHIQNIIDMATKHIHDAGLHTATSNLIFISRIIGIHVTGTHKKNQKQNLRKSAKSTKSVCNNKETK
jgi:hypothetical protein